MKRETIENRALEPNKKVKSTEIDVIPLDKFKNYHDFFIDIETYLDWVDPRLKPYIFLETIKDEPNKYEERKKLTSLFKQADTKIYFCGVLTKPITIETQHKPIKDDKGRDIYILKRNEIGFLKELFIACRAQRKIPRVFFHNTGYDLPVLFDELKQLDPTIRCYYAMKKNGDFIHGRMGNQDFAVDIKDTQLFKRISLEKIASMMYKSKDKQKGTISYTKTDVHIQDNQLLYTDYMTGDLIKVPIEDEKNYLIKDLIITADYWDKLCTDNKSLLKEFLPHYNESIRNRIFERISTTSSLAKWLFNALNGSKGRRDVLHEKYKPVLDESTYDSVENSNLGGFTAYNKQRSYHQCCEGEEIKYYDANSMYPTVLSGLVPYGEFLDTPPEGTYLEWYVLNITKCKWKEPYSFLSRAPLNQRVISSTLLTVDFYLPRKDWEFLMTMADATYTIKKSVYQKTDYAMKDFMSLLYTKRKYFKAEAAKHQPDSNERKYYDNLEDSTKVMLNSTYGRLGLKVHREHDMYDGEDCMKHTYEETDPLFESPITGVFITATARTILLEKVKKLTDNGFTIFYVDTDSVQVLCRKDQEALFEEIMGKDSDQLGGWKNEGNADKNNPAVYTCFYGMGICKKYFLGAEPTKKSKLALSGVDRKIKNAIERKLEKKPTEAMKEAKFIFSTLNNVIFLEGKTNRCTPQDKYKPILYPVDIQTHSTKKTIDGLVTYDHNRGEYKLTIFETPISNG